MTRPSDFNQSSTVSLNAMKRRDEIKRAKNQSEYTGSRPKNLRFTNTITGLEESATGIHTS
jgi:hypothetical protein